MTADAQLKNMSHRGHITLVSPRLSMLPIWRAIVHATGKTIEARSQQELVEKIQSEGASHAQSI